MLQGFQLLVQPAEKKRRKKGNLQVFSLLLGQSEQGKTHRPITSEINRKNLGRLAGLWLAPKWLGVREERVPVFACHCVASSNSVASLLLEFSVPAADPGQCHLRIQCEGGGGGHSRTGAHWSALTDDAWSHRRRLLG